MSDIHIASPEEAEFYRRNHRRMWLTLLCLISVVAGYRPLVFIMVKLCPISWENRLGDMLASDTKDTLTDPMIVHDVETITQRLLSACPHQPYTFHFDVVRSTEHNAYAIPGGHIVIESAFVEDMESPDELAGVLAHEIEHVLHRHTLEQLMYSNGAFVLQHFFSGNSAGFYYLLRQLSELHFSRSQEKEADVDGLRLILRARIAPRGMINFFKRLSQKSGTSENMTEMISTHPSDKHRVETLESVLKNTAHPSAEPILMDWALFKRRCKEETSYVKK